MSRFRLACLCFLGLSCVVVAQGQVKPPQEKIASHEETQMKSVKEFYSRLEGDWKGSYKLWLRPGTPAQESEIKASFRPAAKGNYFLMTYSWKTGDEAQEGVFFFGGHEKAATVTWGDSFHSVPEPMQCKGELDDRGEKLVVKGSYSAGEGPAWGWRTEFTQRGHTSLLMEAYNIMPDGVEALAVRAELRRITKK